MAEPYPDALLDSIRKALEEVAPEGATVATVKNSGFGSETIEIKTCPPDHTERRISGAQLLSAFVTALAKDCSIRMSLPMMSRSQGALASNASA